MLQAVWERCRIRSRGEEKGWTSLWWRLCSSREENTLSSVVVIRMRLVISGHVILCKVTSRCAILRSQHFLIYSITVLFVLLLPHTWVETPYLWSQTSKDPGSPVPHHPGFSDCNSLALWQSSSQIPGGPLLFGFFN